MVFHSTIDSATCTLQNIPLSSTILEKCKGHGDRIAIIDGSKSTPTDKQGLTFSQIAQLMTNVATHLHHDFQVKKQQVIALLLPNMPLFPVFLHGIGLIGAVSTTVNPLYSQQEITDQFNDSTATMVITIDLFLEKTLKSIAGGKTGVKKVFILGNHSTVNPEQLEDSTVEILNAQTSLLSPSEHPLPQVTIDPKEDLLVLPYSSGTQGVCKGVKLTHYNLLSNVTQFTNDFEHWTTDDVIIGVLPFFHIYGMSVFCNKALLEGSTTITMPRFDLEQFLKAIQDYRATRAYLVPPIILALAKHPIVSQFDLSSLKFITSGAAPLSNEVCEMASKRLNIIIKQGYGLSEASPILVGTRDDPSKVRLSSSGELVPHTVLKIIDTATGEEITEYNKSGELCFKGPQIMKGYLNNEAADKVTLIDGFLHTGDIGYISEEGFIYIVDRLKELIKYKGFQVPPGELEGILLKNPKILDAAVIGVPDEESGELPKAFVVLRQGQEMSEQEVMDFVAEVVSPQRRVRLVEFVQEIPKTTSGKILRRVLKQRELEKQQK